MDHLNIASLCAGGGGLELGIRLVLPCARTVVYVEREAQAISHLVAGMEDGWLDEAPIHTDVCTFDGRPWRGVVGAVAAGFPCQGWSQAGRKLGQADPRHLWPEVRRVIGEIEPGVAWLENVSGLVTNGGLEIVLRDLQAMGYETAAGLFTAAEVGAPHRRERVFILAVVDAERAGLQGSSGSIQAKPNSNRENHGLPVATERDVANPTVFSPRNRNPGEQDQEGLGWSGPADGRPALANPGCKRPQGLREDGTEAGPAGRGGGTEIHVFPPCPTDVDGWREVISERPELAPAVSAVCQLAHGVADRAASLRVLGNGVVPLQSAYAFVSLWCALRREAMGELALASAA